MNECIEYLKSIKISSGLLIESTKKVGVKGLIIDMISLMKFYEEYVENAALAELPVYLLNQDPLESFFSRMRSFPALGNNENPTVPQFSAAYRKNVYKSEITSSAFPNCVDALNILYVPSTSHNNGNQANDILLNGSQHAIEETEFNESHVENLAQQECDYNFTDKCDETVTIAFIATEIEDVVTKRLQTDYAYCSLIFEENDKIEIGSIPNRRNIPCKHTYHICRIAYEQLETYSKKIDFEYAELLSSINSKIDYNIMFGKSVLEHDHKRKICEMIAQNFIRVRATYIAKNITLQQKSHQLRAKAKKNKQFAGG